MHLSEEARKRLYKAAMVGQDATVSHSHIVSLGKELAKEIEERKPHVHPEKLVADAARRDALTKTQVNRLVEETNKAVVSNILMSSKRASENVRVDKKKVSDILEGYEKKPEEMDDRKVGPAAPPLTSLQKQANAAMVDYDLPPSMFFHEGPADLDVDFSETQRTNPFASGLSTYGIGGEQLEGPTDEGDLELSEGLGDQPWWSDIRQAALDEQMSQPMSQDFSDFAQGRFDGMFEQAKEGYLKKVAETFQLFERGMQEGDSFEDIAHAVLTGKGDHSSLDMLKQASVYLARRGRMRQEEAREWQEALEALRPALPGALPKHAYQQVKTAGENAVDEKLLAQDMNQYYKVLNGGHVLMRALKELHEQEHRMRGIRASMMGLKAEKDSGVRKYVRETRHPSSKMNLF